MEVMNENSGQDKEGSHQQYYCNYNDEKWVARRRMSKVFIGAAIVCAGALLLLKRTGSAIPDWIFTWPMVLVLAGIASAIRHGFKRFHSYFILLIGLAFLSDKIFLNVELRPFIWPVAIMVIGLFVIFKPRRHHWHHRWHHKYQHWHRNHYHFEKKKFNVNSEDYLEVSAVFGNVTRNVISKNFQGGEINSVFGGAEINLSQADIEGTAELELNQVFGSTKLIVPPHWKIRSEQSAVFGGIEDKRPVQPGVAQQENKVLVLKGHCVFGGIDIRSF